MPPPPPAQQPRIPIWVVGAWPAPRSMDRVLRYDGIIPSVVEDGKTRQATPDELRAIVDYVAEHRTESGPFDVVVEGETPGGDPARAADIVQPWIDAGATWWIEAMWNVMGDRDAVRRRVRSGPPRTSQTSRR
jgi:hypothetical protein